MKKIYLNLLVVAAVFLFSPTISARTIIFNINNNNSAGNLYTRDENVVVGDVIRFTNNLTYTITNTSGTMDCFLQPSNAGSMNVTLAPNQFFEVQVINQSVTNYTFIHDQYKLNKYYNNRINLVFPALESKSFFSDEEFQMTSANPVEDKVMGKFAEVQSKLKIELFDLEGKSLKSQELSESKGFEFEMSELEAGLYLLNIESDGRKTVKKLLKK